MNPDINPQVILIVLLVEVLFGLAYNELVAWAHQHQLMHVSVSVVFGVAGTVLIPAGTWFDDRMPFWQAGILLMLCFAASGIPMIVGSTRRSVAEKDNKKRRPWPTAALRIRDEAMMELSMMANDIAEKARAGELTVMDLPSYVNRLHSVIGMLRSA